MKAQYASILVLCLSGAAFCQEDKLSINADHAFMDMQSVELGIIPVEVTVANAGRDAIGAVTMTAGSYRMTYPVELPNGSKKRFIAYLPTSMQYSFSPRAEFILDTNQGSLKQYFELQQGMGNSVSYFLYVGDQIGLMTFMRQIPGAERNPDPSGSITGCRDVYAKPGRLPTRAVGFRNINAVVLGEGSERLTDNEVEGLKLYAISGGTIVVPGGVSQPILSDPRWMPFLPVRSASPLTVPAFSWLKQFDYGKPIGGSISVLKATPTSSASSIIENGVPVVSTCPLGLGRVVFLAFSPFEGPLETWNGRQSLFRSLLGSFSASAFDQLTTYRQEPMYPPGYMGPSPYSESSDPFRVTLPPVSIVAMILLVYTVLVVPMNLILLRKLNRAQWAWWTTPIISLGFAGIFFQFASRLYSASLSTARSGVVVVDDRFGESLFVGNMKMFFPRGGSYDLGFSGVETVLPTDTNEYDYGNAPRGSVMDSMNAVDFGEIKTDSMRVKNLSFHEFSMVQRLPSSKWLTSDLVDTITTEYGHRMHALKGTIRNNSLYAIQGNLVVDRTQVSSLSLDAGKSVSINLKVTESDAPIVSAPNTPMGPSGMYSAGGPMQGLTNLNNISQPLMLEGMPGTASFAHTTRVMIRGTIVGFKPGPKIGNDTTGTQQIGFIALLGSTVIKEAK